MYHWNKQREKCYIFILPAPQVNTKFKVISFFSPCSNLMALAAENTADATSGRLVQYFLIIYGLDTHYMRTGTAD